jgi:hypothetical protein
MNIRKIIRKTINEQSEQSDNFPSFFNWCLTKRISDEDTLDEEINSDYDSDTQVTDLIISPQFFKFIKSTKVPAKLIEKHILGLAQWTVQRNNPEAKKKLRMQL